MKGTDGVKSAAAAAAGISPCPSDVDIEAREAAAAAAGGGGKEEGDGGKRILTALKEEGQDYIQESNFFSGAHRQGTKLYF